MEALVQRWAVNPLQRLCLCIAFIMHAVNPLQRLSLSIAFIMHAVNPLQRLGKFTEHMC